MSCTAVGDSSGPGPSGEQPLITLAEQWNGRAWSIQPTPDPIPTWADESGLTGVSWTAPQEYTAVGEAINSATGAQTPRAYRYSH